MPVPMPMPDRPAPRKPAADTLRPVRFLPVRFIWTGTAMVPFEGFRPLCERQYVVGDRYVLVPYDPRSRLSHGHYFACVQAAWENWPETYPRHLADADQLRKHALIATGHYDQSTGVHKTADEAAAFVATIMRAVDYAEFSIAGTAVVLRLAKTQKKRVMGAAQFQRSKQDVLDFLSSVLGLDVTTLAREAQKRRLPTAGPAPREQA